MNGWHDIRDRLSTSNAVKSPHIDTLTLNHACDHPWWLSSGDKRLSPNPKLSLPHAQISVAAFLAFPMIPEIFVLAIKQRHNSSKHQARRPYLAAEFFLIRNAITSCRSLTGELAIRPLWSSRQTNTLQLDDRAQTLSYRPLRSFSGTIRRVAGSFFLRYLSVRLAFFSARKYPTERSAGTRSFGVSLT